MTTLTRFSRLADTTAFRAALGLARSIESAAGDWFMNVRTGKALRFQERRGLNGDAFDFETNAHTTLAKVTRMVQLLPSDIVFVIGCGRGRAVCHFARRRVRKVVGIELDLSLCEDARSNALSLRGRHASIEIRHGDAAAEDVSDGTVFFLFNPFGEQTLRAFLHNIESSHTRPPERLVIVYANPRYAHVFQEFEWLTVSHSYRGFGGLHVQIHQSRHEPESKMNMQSRELRFSSFDRSESVSLGAQAVLSVNRVSAPVTAATVRERGERQQTHPAAEGEPSDGKHGSLRILVGIANFGVKNRKYLDRLISEYRSMPFHTDIHIFSEKEKDYPDGVRVHVGLPISNPWSLPFAHRQVFADHVDDYDLFVYSEDDTLIEARHVLAFLRASESLGAGLVPGFIRYEVREDGRRSYPDFHGAYRWISDSVTRAGAYTHARLSNDHSACYLLTRSQLRSAIASGGYLVPPHSGRYDMLCSAGTDTYTQCGLSRVICISHLDDFEIHHLSDAYVKGSGMINKDCAVLDGEGLLVQIEALKAVCAGDLRKEQLFATEKRLATQRWDKSYYEPPDDTLLDQIPATATSVLSIGCGAGNNESRLKGRGMQVVAVPLDAVIGRMAEQAGIRVTSPDLDAALRQLDGSRFDAILLSDVVQHLEDPVQLLTRLSSLLSPAGVLVGSVPNLGPIRRWSGRLFSKNPVGYRLSSGWHESKLRLTSAGMLAGWLKRGGLRPLSTVRAHRDKLRPTLPLRELIAPSIYFAAKRTSDE